MKPEDLGKRNERIARFRKRLSDIREQIRRQFEAGATGAQTSGLLCELLDQFLASVINETLASWDPAERAIIESQTSLIAVGGTGRAELCPFSDIDLLFLASPTAFEVFRPFAAWVQRDLGDTGLDLGASTRTVGDAIVWSKQDAQFATSLVQTRLLWGSKSLYDQLESRYKKGVRSRVSQFINDVVDSRETERKEHSATTQQLEPDVKRSLGGLRDLHLIRWIGFAIHGESDINSLRLKGAIEPDDARQLLQAFEFLTRLRFDLHLHAGREQDVLTRDDQLRIAKARNIPGGPAQLPVERFMQEYFQHCSAVASIAKRFVAGTRISPLSERILHFVFSHRVDDIFYVGMGIVDVSRRHRTSICGTVEGVLRLYLTAVRTQSRVAPHLIEQIKQQHLKPTVHLSSEAAQLFLALLKTPGQLGAALRDLHETEVLDCVLPCWGHIRCLLQFNQYHHFTVDEHTLRTIEAAEQFAFDPGPIGQAYREIHHKELLHLALLLHDAGKGFEEDHSEVGRRLAFDVANRLGLPDHQRELIMMLVHKHLQMADIALKRDISDPGLLLRFSHEVGSADALRMLFVLTACDISAVGPGVWNDWKAELTTTLYDRTMLWLSGKSHLFDESARLSRIQQEVLECWISNGFGEPHHDSASAMGTTATRTSETVVSPENQTNILSNAPFDAESISKRLELCPAHYLLETPPERIAADFRVIQSRQPNEIHVEAKYDPENKTVEYRVILHESIASGCFHKLSGALSAKRLEILSAAICTTQDGVIIDAYRVRDADHAGEIPDFRIADVASAIRRVLRGEIDVETLLKARGRFAVNAVTGPVSGLPLRVVIDNESSPRYTVIDVFAHDRPGLLYAITRKLFELKLSVVLSKIATYFDQVLDVFFVTDESGHKIHDGARLKTIRDQLLQSLSHFESDSNAE